MTLSERVRAAESAQASAQGRLEASGFSVEDLRQGVRECASLEEIAAIAVENPKRARNELKAACRTVLAQPRWNACTVEEGRKLTDELIDIVFGMGPIEGLIDDESVTEIMVNATKSIYYERDGKLVRSALSFESDEQVRSLIDRIIGPLGRRIDESSPMVNARLPQGHRVNAIIPPLAIDGPHLTIRSFTRRVMTLQEMQECGSLDQGVRTFLQWLVVGRKNIVVSGGTGSGKTTLLNALSCVVPHGERVVTIEDSAELRFSEHPHVVRLEARARNAEGEGEVTIRDLVTNALRMRPDRIIVGECRGGEAIDMLQAMNTGHDGSLTTLHANSPQDVIDRMVTMVRFAIDLPVDAIEAQIGSAFDYIIQVARARSGLRYVAQIAEAAFDRATRRCVVVPLYQRDPAHAVGFWVRHPSCMDDLVASGFVEAEEVRAWELMFCGEQSPLPAA